MNDEALLEIVCGLIEMIALQLDPIKMEALIKKSRKYHQTIGKQPPEGLEAVIYPILMAVSKGAKLHVDREGQTESSGGDPASTPTP